MTTTIIARRTNHTIMKIKIIVRKRRRSDVVAKDAFKSRPPQTLGGAAPLRLQLVVDVDAVQQHLQRPHHTGVDVVEADQVGTAAVGALGVGRGVKSLCLSCLMVCMLLSVCLYFYLPIFISAVCFLLLFYLQQDK